ncbi:MAG: hypothetical protein IJ061_04705 [Lachnospiraceae bacterium]|nr:hypothetical protein [Lachnospiraceae bacterium]
MKKTGYRRNLRRSALMALLLIAAILISACGGKEEKPDSGSSSGNVSGSNTAGGAGNVSGGNSGSGSGGKDAAEQEIQSLAADYGVNMPDGIVSLADPNAVYESGNVIQMNSLELYISMDTASDWVDSVADLTAGNKYISVPVTLDDYGAGTVKEIPTPDHYYLIAANDGNGNPLELGAQRLQPKTNMRISEIKGDVSGYYAAERPLVSGGMKLWLLYEVPEATREITVACWVDDQFQKPADAAYKLKVEEKQVPHNFENQSRDEILREVQTKDRPVLEDFAWYTEDLFQNLDLKGYRDPEYDVFEYEGGWKCYILKDFRQQGQGFEAHLANLYVEQVALEDTSDFGKGHVDVRIDWYLAIDENGNVTDESGLPDTVCSHEEFYYNRMENEDSTYPFASFSFQYIQDRAVGWGYYVTPEKQEWKLAVVRPDGNGLWIRTGDRPTSAVLPGTADVPIPASMTPTSTASASGMSQTSVPSSSSSGTSSSPAPGTSSSSAPGTSSQAPGTSSSSQAPGSGSSANPPAAPGSSSSGQTSAGTGGNTANVTLNDFGWYFDDDFPIDGNPLTELQDLGGKWKGLINVVTPVNGEDQCRIAVFEAEVQYMGYKVTLLLNTKEQYQFMVSDPDNIETLDASGGGTIVMEGDWNDEIGYFDAASSQTALNVTVYDFVEAGGVEYALGSVFNGDREIGEIAMCR